MKDNLQTITINWTKSPKKGTQTIKPTIELLKNLSHKEIERGHPT